MLYQITVFLLDVIVGLLAGACLLRLYMQLQRVPFGNPIGRFVFAVSDWLVLPLRRVLPSVRGWDLASLVGAWMLELVQLGLVWLLFTGNGNPLLTLPVAAAFSVVRLMISGLTMLVIVYAVLSWVQSNSPLVDVIDRLCAPLLRPFRRLIPLVGGIDLSPLALLVALQIAGIVLGALQLALRA